MYKINYLFIMNKMEALPQPTQVSDQELPPVDHILAEHSIVANGGQPRNEKGQFQSPELTKQDELLGYDNRRAHEEAVTAVDHALDTGEVPDALKLPRDWSDTLSMHQDKEREHIANVNSSLQESLGSHEDHKANLRQKRDVTKQSKWDSRFDEIL